MKVISLSMLFCTSHNALSWPEFNLLRELLPGFSQIPLPELRKNKALFFSAYLLIRSGNLIIMNSHALCAEQLVVGMKKSWLSTDWLDSYCSSLAPGVHTRLQRLYSLFSSTHHNYKQKFKKSQYMYVDKIIIS